MQAVFAVIYRSVQELPRPSKPSQLPIPFVCGGCGLTMSVPVEQAGSSGPCPGCGVWLTSPGGPTVVTPGDPGKSRSAPAAGRRPARTGTRRKGRIRADSMIDHAHIERSETAKSVVMLACFVLAVCACIAVTWFLKDWLTR